MKVRLLLSDYHFGYGSNLNWSDWKKWCNERNKDPNSLKAEPGTFVLPDYELEFHYYSGGRRGGALDVVKLRGHAVAGMLFQVSDDGWDSLDAKEGHPNYYERKKVQVLSENGELRTAITYVVVPDRVKKEHVPPRPNYIEAVERGYEYHGITKTHPWAKIQLLASVTVKVNVPAGIELVSSPPQSTK